MGAIPTRQLSFQPVAIGAAGEVTNLSKPSMERVALGDSASRQAVTRVNAEQASKQVRWEPTQQRDGEGRRRRFSGERLDPTCDPTGVLATACRYREIERNTGNPSGGRVAQPDAREGQAGPPRGGGQARSTVETR